MIRSFSVGLFLVLVAGVSVFAQQPRAAITPQQADADFALQGEFAGPTNIGPFGLQVVAQGNGRFSAVVYRGGLPGAGWDKQTKSKLSGNREQDRALLTGTDYSLVVMADDAWLQTPGGQALGRLPRVQRVSPTMGLAPAPRAIILFDGTVSDLRDAQVSKSRLLQIGATTDFDVRDFHMHLEFKTPYQPAGRDQGRGNSGVYIQRRYELQILDSFGLDGAFNECGALYRQTSPDINMCLPPLSWQTYDIWFTAPKFEQGRKVANARLTAWHNGVPIHQDREITAKTGAGQAEGPRALPIHFQNHGNPVEFRNLWIELGRPVHPLPAVEELPEPCRPVFCECFEASCGLLRRLFH
jgi:hypothetical protein